MSKTLAFDIGHASIGWSVLESSASEKDPEILGTGAVIFPTDDCLASQRRDFRRTRRHIRSTRQRIERLKCWLEHRRVISREDLDKPGHPAPFLLAAAALQGHCTLDSWQLWTVLRWYAHNRGYDGNARWAVDVSEEEDDTQKVSNARSLMDKHGAKTMAETVCACLALEPAKYKKRISSWLPYKTLNAAFPREVVEKEVSELLGKHIGHVPGFDGETVRIILAGGNLEPKDRESLQAAGIKLPLRYRGGLLFGQLVPRFDNRIISTCPVTYAEVHDRELEAGKSEEEACHIAKRESKVPAARCREFLEYRFARVLANIRADGKPLDGETRRQLFETARTEGYFTHAKL
jgi:CRISPR-associated endonuclease Csn1